MNNFMQEEFRPISFTCWYITFLFLARSKIRESRDSFQAFFIHLPVEKWAWIGLTTRGNIGMAGDVVYRVCAPETPGQFRQGGVLAFGEWLEVATFKLDTNGEVIAARSPAPT